VVHSIPSRRSPPTLQAPQLAEEVGHVWQFHVPALHDGKEREIQLERLVAAARVDDLSAIIGALEAAKAAAWARLTAPRHSEGTADRLLDLTEVAEILAVPVDYAYTLARQRKIPTVRLPGLDKGGSVRAGKYVRVRLSALRAWTADHETKALDGSFITVIKSLHDRQRGATDTKAARPLASGLRKAGGCDLCDRQPVGDRSHEDPGAHGQVDSTTRKVG
jgi:hypothetical protein